MAQPSALAEQRNDRLYEGSWRSRQDHWRKTPSCSSRMLSFCIGLKERFAELIFSRSAVPRPSPCNRVPFVPNVMRYATGGARQVIVGPREIQPAALAGYYRFFNVLLTSRWNSSCSVSADLPTISSNVRCRSSGETSVSGSKAE